MANYISDFTVIDYMMNADGYTLLRVEPYVELYPFDESAFLAERAQDEFATAAQVALGFEVAIVLLLAMNIAKKFKRKSA